jgi:hypothetical protein
MVALYRRRLNVPMFLLSTLVFACTAPGLARGGFFDNAADLARACKAATLDEPDSLMRAGEAVACLGYVNGFWHGYHARSEGVRETGKICWPKGVSPKQMAAIYVRWMHQNPQHWHEGPFEPMHRALAAAFPCTR